MLKVGGEVTVISTRNSKLIRTIDRETRTLWVLSDGSKFRKSDETVLGNSKWYSSFITPTTDEHRNEIMRIKLLHNIKNTHFHGLTTEQLESIVSIIEGK